MKKFLVFVGILGFLTGCGDFLPVKKTIGKNYGGGIVFWVDSSGKHGLIAATEDQSTGIRWNNGENMETGATNDGVYAGKTNTELIISKQGAGSYAAQICANYRGGGYDDWYLPSKKELKLLFQKKGVVGNFANDYYWSSNENNIDDVVFLYSETGHQYHYSKRYPYNRVRAIRAF